MAFIRSLPLRFARNLERADVNLAMRKWWKLGYHKTEGVVSKPGRRRGKDSTSQSQRVPTTLTSLRFSSPLSMQITQTLSPFEQQIIAPLFENFPYKLWDKYGRRWVKDIGPALLACYGGMKWADWKYEELIRECWD
jgi:hypothetical protein